MRDQLHRLFSTTIRWTYTDESQGHANGRGYVIAGEHELWWSVRNSVQPPLWRSRVILGQGFFEGITRSAVPIDLRAFRLLKRSPLALDIYVWLTYRMSYLRRACLIPWKGLQKQFGAEFVEQIASVLIVYPAARVLLTSEGLVVKPSAPHIARAGSRVGNPSRGLVIASHLPSIGGRSA